MQISPIVKKERVLEAVIENRYGDCNDSKSCFCKTEDITTKHISCVSNSNKDD